MRILVLFVVIPFFVSSFSGFVSAQSKTPQYKKIVVSDKFHAEGACIGDFNKDGVPDVAMGHFWYEGPGFTKPHQFFDGTDYNPANAYSECFGMFTGDFNQDGWDDILICPHPGTDSFWHENPKQSNPKDSEGFWKTHPVSKELGNESQEFVEIFGDGRKSLLFNRNGWLGFATPNPEKPYDAWDFTALNEKEDNRFQRYSHGLGHGDINGDGKTDILERGGWWEQPADADAAWKMHQFPFADAAAHLLVYDVDGDGLNDVVTALHCHLYGFAWYKQVRKNGEISFEQKILIPRSDQPFAESENSFPKISQLHAQVLADINDDGIADVITGKRFWAHGDKGDVEPDAPAILMWWETKRSGEKTTLVPHIIDDNSGVGTQFAVGDVNGDAVPDIVIGNKKGAFVFLSQP